MKSALSGILVAFSMYSTIPVKQIPWQKSTMRWALSFLPIIGLIIGLFEWLWYIFCTYFNASPIFYSIIAAIIPIIISGGIHLDGLCDTCDALCSFGDIEKKLAILKDAHIGAFGSMWLMVFLLFEIACFAQLYKTPKYLIFAFIGFSIARALGGSKIVLLPCAKNSGLANIFSQNSDKKIVLFTLIFEAILFLILTTLAIFNINNSILISKILICIVIIWYFIHNKLCKDIFGGITGDLAGFFICTTELIFLLVPTLGGMIL